MDVETTPHAEKRKNRVESESDSHSHEERKPKLKKDKKASKEKRDSKKKKHSKATPVLPEVNKKKRKAVPAELSEEEQVSKKATNIDAAPLDKVLSELRKLCIPVDDSKLGKLKRQHAATYDELVELMGSPKTKGLIFTFSVKTPIGRIFWYVAKERKFFSLRNEHNLIKLVDYANEKSLNVVEIQKSLTDSQRKACLDCLKASESDLVPAERWLYALIETGIIKREAEKPHSTQAAEAVLFHDDARKQTLWLGSTKAKEIFPLAIVTRARTITENNIEAELKNLYDKRKAISNFIESHDCLVTATLVTLSEPLNKSRATELVPAKTAFDIHKEHEEPKKKAVKSAKPPAKKRKTEKPSQAQVTSASSEEEAIKPKKPVKKQRLPSSSSSSSSESEDSQPCSKAEARLKAQLMKKHKGQIKSSTEPNATTIAKSLEVKRNIDEALKHKKVIDDLADPEIRFFRTTCC